MTDDSVTLWMILFAHFGITCAAWMIAFDTESHEGPAGPGRKRPRLWFFLCMIWEVFLVYAIVKEILCGLYKIVVLNKLED